MSRFVPNPTLFPFQSRWITLKDGSKVHYVDEGNGPTLLLLHGNPTWSFLYRNIILGLRMKFRCVAPDLPGFGLSSPSQGFTFSAAEQSAAIIDFVDCLGLSSIGVVMQDWGGPIGLNLAVSRPRAVERLIIGNTFGWPFTRLGPRFFSAFMGGIPGQLSAWAFNGVLRWFCTYGVTKPLSRDVWAMYQAPFAKRLNRRPTHIFPKQLVAADTFLRNVEMRLPSISSKPSLILWGGKDFAFQDYERERFCSAFPNHEVVLLPNAGHFIQEDAPAEICSAILDWYRCETSVGYHAQASSAAV